MLVRRRPELAGAPATRSYSPSMLLSWMPVPGTITPEPEPVDEESDAAFPCSSTAETCVVPPAGVCSARPGSDASIRRTAAASGSSERSCCASPPRWSRVANGSARARVCSRITSASEASASAVPGSPPRTRSSSASPYAIRMPPDDGGGFEITSCSRYADANRPAPDDPVRREIVRRQLPAACGDGPGGLARQVAAVEDVGALGGDARQRLAEVGQPQHVARLHAATRRHGCRGAFPPARAGGSGRGSRAGAPAAARARRPPAPARSRAGAAPPRAGCRTPRGRPRGRPPPRARRRRPPRSGRPGSSRCRRRSRRRSHASRRRGPAGRPSPGVATKKSAIRGGRPSPGRTSAKPPAPGPVSGLSATQPANAAATQASTALPPSASIRAPASAVRGCPAAIAPFTWTASQPMED